MNAAAQVVSGTKMYDNGLTHLLHSELHWLDVADRVTYKLGVTVYKCLHSQAPDYLSELCTPVAQVAEWQHLCSAIRHLLVVPRFQLDMYGRRTFCVSLTCKLTVFVVHWIRVFLISTRHIERIRGAFCDDALYKLTFTFTCTLVENREIFIPHVYLAHPQRVTPSEFRKTFDAGKTRVTGLPYSVKTVTIC